jgi:hypothetical protein
MIEINNPSEKIYFIVYDNTEIFGYGTVDTNQVLKSPREFLFQTTDEEEWKTELLSYGVVFEEETDNLE